MPWDSILEVLVVGRMLLGWVLLGVSAATAFAQSSPAPGFQPMNLMVTPARVAEVQRARGRDPVVDAAVQQLMQEASSRLTVAPNPIAGVLSIPGFYTSQRTTQQQLTRRLRRDAAHCHCLATAAAFGATPDHARKAEEFLFAWVDRLTGARDGPFSLLAPHGDTALVVAYSFPRFLYAYDILRGLGRIDASERRRFETWLRRFVHYVRSRPGILIDRWNNHQSWKALFLLCAGHVLEDRALFDEGAREYRQGLAHQIDGEGAMWRELIRGRKAATYTVMSLEAMVQSAVILARHGSPETPNLAVIRSAPLAAGVAGADLKRALDRLAEFVEDPATWGRYQHMTGTSPLNGPAAQTDWGWLYELPAAWWGDPRYARLRAGTYGLLPARAYTLSYATLLFRPL